MLVEVQHKNLHARRAIFAHARLDLHHLERRHFLAVRFLAEKLVDEPLDDMHWLQVIFECPRCLPVDDV